jgi:hypothetical protein
MAEPDRTLVLAEREGGVSVYLTTVFTSGTLKTTVRLSWTAPTLEAAVRALKQIAPDAVPTITDPDAEV